MEPVSFIDKDGNKPTYNIFVPIKVDVADEIWFAGAHVPISEMLQPD